MGQLGTGGEVLGGRQHCQVIPSSWGLVGNGQHIGVLTENNNGGRVYIEEGLLTNPYPNFMLSLLGTISLVPGAYHGQGDLEGQAQRVLFHLGGPRQGLTGC